jgi:hypothetical protein
MKKTDVLLFGLLLMVLFIIIALSTLPPSWDVSECVKQDDAYGFWGGLWHGMISPISFIASLFSDNIEFYCKNNNGGWYNFGFVLGGGLLFKGSKSNKK